MDIIMIKKAIRTICNGYANPITFLLLLCPVLNPSATILGKKLVLNLRLTLCALKTLLLIV